MGIFEAIKQLVSGVQNGAGAVGDLKAKGQQLASEYGDTVNNVVDTAQKIIPGEQGDAVIDNLQGKLDSFAGEDQKQ